MGDCVIISVDGKKGHERQALAVAARIPLRDPALQTIPAMDLVDLPPVAGPVQGNVADGAATAALLQAPGGHFVAFDDSTIRSSINAFFASFDEGLPTIP